MAKGNKNPPLNPVFRNDRALASRAGKKSKTPSKGLVELRKNWSTDVEEAFYKYSKSSLPTLRRYLKEEKLPSVDLHIINIIILGVSGGDYQRLNFLLERTMGKVKDRIEVSTDMSHKTIVEQIEEEDLFRNIVSKLELFPEEDGVALLLLDQELGQRE